MTFEYKLRSKYVPDEVQHLVKRFDNNPCMLYYGTLYLSEYVEHDRLSFQAESHHRTEPLLDRA
jgi:hypothetical protein